MSFTIHIPKAKPRNAVARDMVLSGQCRRQVFKDKRTKRSKDARKKRETFDYGQD
jgi:hypothetical protein